MRGHAPLFPRRLIVAHVFVDEASALSVRELQTETEQRLKAALIWNKQADVCQRLRRPAPHWTPPFVATFLRCSCLSVSAAGIISRITTRWLVASVCFLFSHLWDEQSLAGGGGNAPWAGESEPLARQLSSGMCGAERLHHSSGDEGAERGHHGEPFRTGVGRSEWGLWVGVPLLGQKVGGDPGGLLVEMAEGFSEGRRGRKKRSPDLPARPPSNPLLLA